MNLILLYKNRYLPAGFHDGNGKVTAQQRQLLIVGAAFSTGGTGMYNYMFVDTDGSVRNSANGVVHSAWVSSRGHWVLYADKPLFYNGTFKSAGSEIYYISNSGGARLGMLSLDPVGTKW